MPIYRGRRPGTLRVVVWAGGTQHEEIIEGTRSEAREHEARLRIELGARGRRRQRIAPLFSEFSTADYAPHARARLGADTWRNARKYIVATLTEHFGAVRLDALATSHVNAYQQARIEAGIRPNVINAELGVLGAMLSLARELELPVADLRWTYLPAPKRRVRTWTPAEVSKLCATCQRLDPAMLPMLVFLLNTGARKGELTAAPWTWVDWRRRLLCIGPHEGWTPKSKRPREVPLSDALVVTLRSLPRSTRWIFPNRDGERFARFPGERFRLVVRAAGLQGGPHTARHTFASFFLASGGSLHELSALLGHSATRTTELYAHLLPDHLDRTRNRVNLDARGRNPGGTLAKKRAS